MADKIDNRAPYIYKATPGKFWNRSDGIRTNHGVSLVIRLKDERIDFVLGKIGEFLAGNKDAYVQRYLHSTVIAMEFNKGKRIINGGAQKYASKIHDLLSDYPGFQIKITKLCLNIKEGKEARIRLEGEAALEQARKKLVKAYNFSFVPNNFISINMVTFVSPPKIDMQRRINNLLHHLSGKIIGQTFDVEQLFLVYHRNNFLEGNIEEIAIPLRSGQSMSKGGGIQTAQGKDKNV